MTAPIGSSIKAALKGLLKMAGLLIGAAIALLFISLFFEEPLKVFFNLLAIAGTGMMLLSVASMLLTFRQARGLEPVALLVSLAVSVASTLVSLWLSASLPSLFVLLLGFAVGGAAGTVWSRTTLLFIDGGEVRGRGTLWYLAIWAASFAISQVVTAVSGQSAGVATFMMLASAGLAAGNSIGLIIRVRRVLSTLPAVGGAGQSRVG